MTYEEKVKKLFSLKIGEYIKFEPGLTFVGAPGGWVYEASIMREEGLSISCCFVPFPEQVHQGERVVDEDLMLRSAGAFGRRVTKGEL